METSNPYRAPRAKVEADPRLPTLEATRKRRRLMAFAILGMSVVGSLFYVIMDEVLLQTAVGAWPMLFGTAIASIISSILTRHLSLTIEADKTRTTSI